ncbi:hypothetical protein B0H16DRAFT_1544072 [Mycena metata]|uniref:Potassium channel domain-containing protein n=1 Tax=Mycena metata TaxID=1033252 RepID=A0AAD7NBH2_9AGAR|nr:hypothetical protein B0H16DRAFT_1544072 [Mycena metata]
MLRALTIILPFTSGSGTRHPDPEKGSPVSGSPQDLPQSNTRPPSEFVDPGEDSDEDDLDLDQEHDTNDVIRDMEVEEARDEAPARALIRRGRTYSSSLSLITHEVISPAWWTRLREVLNPKTTQQDLESYIPNYRYTPILSGIVIPFSILLEIPGLTEHWYIRTVDNKIVENVPNPTILNVGLGLSMACALAANICLVVRFLEKKVKLMTIGCIVFLTIHDLINITAVTIFGVEHRFNDGFTYGQSFWITVCSTGVSSFTNLTLITDLIRTPDFEKSVVLTRRQRSLAILVILLLCYIALGALIHSILMGLNFIDAMYFTLVSIETIGFGDIHPDTTGGRLFTCIYAAFGIVTIALTVGYRKRVQAVRQRRRLGRWKRRVSNRWREAVEWRLRETTRGLAGKFLDFVDSLIPWPTGDHKSFSYGSGFMMGHGLGYGNHPHGMHLNLEALSWKQKSPLTHARLGRMIAMIGSFALAVDKSSHLSGDVRTTPIDTSTSDDRPEPTPQFKKSLTLQYDAFRAGMQKEETKAAYARLVVAWALFILFWMIGSLIFMKTERWSFGVSLYFCFVAFTTIGYGDYSPQTPAGRSVFVAWALLGVATMTILISVIAEAFSSKYNTAMHAGIFDRAVKRYREHRRTQNTKPQRTCLQEIHTRTHICRTLLGQGNKMNVDLGDDLPPGLQQLMNEITGAEKLGARIKREILQDEDARHTLFTLSIEQALRKMINSAEAALQAVEEREKLMQQHMSLSPTSDPGPDLARRAINKNFPRWDTTTSSEYSDWR